MPRLLDSVNPGGFAAAIDVDEDELEAVVAMLNLADAQESEIAHDQIYAALADLEGARSRTVHANTIRGDLRNLKKLVNVTNPEEMTAPLLRALDGLDSLKANDLALYKRLNLHLPGRQLHDRIASLQMAEETIFGIGREIENKISTIKEEFSSEDGRGRRPDEAALAFASSLYWIWVEFAGRGTSRQNAPERQKDPFGDFVQAAGRLIDPDFKGHGVARQAHELRREIEGQREIGK